MTLTDDTLNLITSDRYNVDFWLFELGRAEIIQTNTLEMENQFMSSFFDNGQRLWTLYSGKVQDILCDKVKREPKEFVQEITSGNIKDIITTVISGLMSTHSLTLAISIPLCSLALKKGINNICK